MLVSLLSTLSGLKTDLLLPASSMDRSLLSFRRDRKMLGLPCFFDEGFSKMGFVIALFLDKQRGVDFLRSF